jgi:hypothetical protein
LWGTRRPKPSRFIRERKDLDVLKSKIEEDESLFVGEYIFETFFKPIDEKSYDSDNDGKTNKQHEVRREHKHVKSPHLRLKGN